MSALTVGSQVRDPRNDGHGSVVKVGPMPGVWPGGAPAGALVAWQPGRSTPITFGHGRERLGGPTGEGDPGESWVAVEDIEVAS